MSTTIEESLLGLSPKVKKALETVRLVGPTDATVLIIGETGTGKELIAKGVHQYGINQKSFIPVNCGAIPESLLESELFGHEKGAFTGAVAMRRGRFERANNGTLFLDEVAEMTKKTQVELLRVLETGEYERVGGEQTLKTNVRIIAAGSRDLELSVKEGSFHPALMHRLKEVVIYLPPLRERLEDILLLAHHYLAHYSIKYKKDLRLADDAEVVLLTYKWLGNIRELRRVMKAAVILYGEPLSKEIFSERIQLVAVSKPNLGQSQDNGSRQYELSLYAPSANYGKRGILFAEQLASIIDPISDHPLQKIMDYKDDTSPPKSVRIGGEVQTLKDMERNYIFKIMDIAQGNRTRASELLGIARRTLGYKLKKLQEEGNQIPIHSDFKPH